MVRWIQWLLQKLTMMTRVYHKCYQKVGLIYLWTTCAPPGARHSHDSQEEKKYEWFFWCNWIHIIIFLIILIVLLLKLWCTLLDSYLFSLFLSFFFFFFYLSSSLKLFKTSLFTVNFFKITVIISDFNRNVLFFKKFKCDNFFS